MMLVAMAATEVRREAAVPNQTALEEVQTGLVPPLVATAVVVVALLLVVELLATQLHL
jgi:hypothetical protein